MKVKVLVIKSCPTLCDPMDCRPPGSSVHGVLQARMMEWVAISFSRGSFQPKDQTRVSCITGKFFTIWATRESLEYWSGLPCPSPEDLPKPGIEARSPHAGGLRWCHVVMGRPGFDPWVGKMPWRRERLPTPVNNLYK